MLNPVPHRILSRRTPFPRTRHARLHRRSPSDTAPL